MYFEFEGVVQVLAVVVCCRLVATGGSLDSHLLSEKRKLYNLSVHSHNLVHQLHNHKKI